MWNLPSAEVLNQIPRLYETETIAPRDKLIHLHFFLGGSDWYIAEYDGNDHMWGFAILNDDLQMAEWGYVSLSELKSIYVSGAFEIDHEIGWEIKPASQIEKICKAQGWPYNR